MAGDRCRRAGADPRLSIAAPGVLRRGLRRAQVEEERWIGDEVVRELGESAPSVSTWTRRTAARASRRPATRACSRPSRRSTRRCRSSSACTSRSASRGSSLFGTDEQKERFLPDLATGRKLAGFALTEPEAGSDAYNVAIARGAAARRLLGAERGEALHRQRLERRRVHDLRPRRGRRQGPPHRPDPREGDEGLRGRRALRHDGPARQRPAPASLQRRPGADRERARRARRGLPRSRCRSSTTGASGSGPARSAPAKKLLDLAIDHVKERRQFDRPLADFELVQEKIGWMVSHLFGLESMCYLTCGLVDAGVAGLLARVGDLQGLRHRVPLVRGQPRAAARGRRRLHARRAVREDPARHPHLPDLRGRQRRDAGLRRARRDSKPVGEKLEGLSGIELSAPIGSIGVLADYAAAGSSARCGPTASPWPTRS